MSLIHTPNSDLAKKMRNKLEILEKVSSIKVKLVESTGDKVIDIFHKSDAWSDIDCERPDCLICASCGENKKKGKCKQRNIIYETFCLICDRPVSPQDNTGEQEREIEST